MGRSCGVSQLLLGHLVSGVALDLEITAKFPGAEPFKSHVVPALSPLPLHPSPCLSSSFCSFSLLPFPSILFLFFSPFSSPFLSSSPSSSFPLPLSSSSSSPPFLSSSSPSSYSSLPPISFSALPLFFLQLFFSSFSLPP